MKRESPEKRSGKPVSTGTKSRARTSSSGKQTFRTLADVARALDLDPSTISLVLSGSTKPSEETRKRVLAFCQKVNFRPNLLAQGLSRGRSGLWGVLFPDIRSSFFPAILEGIETVANERANTSFLSLSKYDPELMRSQIIAMKARYVDGLLIVPTGQQGEREILRPVLGDVPNVFLIFPLEDEPFEACVHVDDEHGGYIGASHLLRLGHRRIALLDGPPRSRVGMLRRIGFERAMKEHGLDIDRSLIAGDDFTSESGYRAADALLNRDNPPTAFFALSDYSALGALEALLDRGLTPGADVAVVGYDDICCGHYSPVPLTTVRQPKEELGEAAARALVSIIDGNPTMPVPLKPTLEVRRSCGESGARFDEMGPHGTRSAAPKP